MHNFILFGNFLLLSLNQVNVAMITITVIPTIPTTRIERPVYQYENDLILMNCTKTRSYEHMSNGESPILDLIALPAVPSSPSAEEKSENRWT